MEFDDDSVENDLTTAELPTALKKGAKYRFWTNACGLNFHLSFDEEQITLCSENICHIMSGSINSVHPFETSFASAFSEKVLDVIKREHFLEDDTLHVVDVLIEWKSFSMLILSSKTSSPADIRVYIGSKEHFLRL
ncbi:MAG: hypothetical protein QCH31_06125 [Methanolobus sp.]|nr:hypothetical protein [Methanolobus sp.]